MAKKTAEKGDNDKPGKNNKKHFSDCEINQLREHVNTLVKLQHMQTKVLAEIAGKV